MANRPPFLCELDKDKLIDTQVGFVDTFNWAVRAIDNLAGEGKVKVDWTLDDHPTITLEEDSDGSSSGGGDGGGGNVEDVSMETYQNGDSLLIEYADGSADKHIPLSYVKDVSQATYQGGPALKVEYSSDANDKYIPLSAGGGGEVQFTGTNGIDGSLSSAFTF